MSPIRHQPKSPSHQSIRPEYQAQAQHCYCQTNLQCGIDRPLIQIWDQQETVDHLNLTQSSRDLLSLAVILLTIVLTLIIVLVRARCYRVKSVRLLCCAFNLPTPAPVSLLEPVSQSATMRILAQISLFRCAQQSSGAIDHSKDITNTSSSNQILATHQPTVSHDGMIAASVMFHCQFCNRTLMTNQRLEK